MLKFSAVTCSYLPSSRDQSAKIRIERHVAVAMLAT